MKGDTDANENQEARMTSHFLSRQKFYHRVMFWRTSPDRYLKAKSVYKEKDLFFFVALANGH